MIQTKETEALMCSDYLRAQRAKSFGVAYATFPHCWFTQKVHTRGRQGSHNKRKES